MHLSATLKAKFLPSAEYQVVVEGFYSNSDLPALALYRFGKLRMPLTVDVTYYNPPPGLAVFKTHSENEGVVDALTEAELIGPVYDFIPFTHTIAVACCLRPLLQSLVDARRDSVN